MRKLFLLIPALILSMMVNATKPTITVDGDKSDWADVPMLSEPGTWPMLKVIPAADAELGTNALVYMMENNADFDPTWAQYPTEFIDKDYDKSTESIEEYWAFKAMGIDYKATTGVTIDENWISFPKAISSDYKVFELGFPATYITDLGSKFGFAMYYNSGAWFCPDYSSPAVSPSNGFLYKTRSFTTITDNTTLTMANVYAHQSIGECIDYVDFGLRDNGNDTARWAAWPLELTQPAMFEVTTNVTSTNGWKFEFWVVDVATNTIVAHLDAPESSVSSSKTSYTFGTLDLTAVPAGKYMLKVKNRTPHSTVKLNSVELAYAGGYVKDIPSTLTPTDAIHNGTIVDGVIKFDDATTGWAKWNVSVASGTYFDIALSIKNKWGHNFTVAIYQEDGTTLVEQVTEGSNQYSANEEGHTLNLGGLYLAAGKYVVKVTNSTEGSDAKIMNLAFTYAGGAVQDMPGTTNIADAWFSANGTRADGKISYSSINSGCWAKWNINVAAAGTYNVTVNISGQYGHQYVVEFLKEGESTPIVVTKGTTNYDNNPTLYANELGSVILEAANYEMKVFNDVGDAALHSVKLDYAGGGIQNMPGTTELMEAWFSSNGTRNNGAIEYTSVSSGCWAKWNLAFAKGGNYNVIVNIRGQYGHQYVVEFLKEGESTPIVVTKGVTNYHNDPTLYANELGMVTLEAGNYEMNVFNDVGDAALISVTLEYLGGARATLPATLDADDALFSEKAYAEGGEIYFSPNPGSQNVYGEWAKWNVNVPTAGTFLFTMAVTSTNSQTYKITILDGETEVDSYEKHPSSGDQTIKHYFNLAAGNYAVKVENTYSWSNGHVVSLVVTQPSLIVLDESAETNAVIHDNYRNGNHDIQIIRSIIPGMYNTICLPFDVAKAQLKAVFGSDVELLKMSAATLSGNELNLNFADAVEGGIYRGTPYLIKTSKAVVNPVFTEVEIKAEEGNATGGEGFDADFIGNFIKGEVPAGDQNLFLGQNNMLYFSQDATPIKGMRAYFHVKVPGAAHAIKHARIVKGTQVITELNLVGADGKVVKTIENGQLIIFRDGNKYNVMGVKLQ